MKKMLLIDGSSMVQSNYYGSAPKRLENESDEMYFNRFLKTSDGRYSNAIAVTLKNIFSLINREQPTYLAIAFDKTRNTFRRKIYSEYKGTRGETPIPLKEQLINIQNILKEIGIMVYISDTYEADDIINSLVNQYKNDKDLHIDVISKDHDYYQLVDNNVTLWQPQISYEKATELYKKYGYTDELRKTMPGKRFPFTPERVEQETGVVPALIPDLKGIIGDTSDNIPGVKGVSSAAAPLLNYYGSLSAIYEALENDENMFLTTCKLLGIKRSPINAFITQKASAFMSKKLATMETLLVSDNINQLKLNINETALNKVVSDWEINSLNGYIKSLKEYNYINNNHALTEKDILNLGIISLSANYTEDLEPIIKRLSCKKKLINVYSDYSIKGITLSGDIKEFIKLKANNKANIIIVPPLINKEEYGKLMAYKNLNIQTRFLIMHKDGTSALKIG